MVYKTKGLAFVCRRHFDILYTMQLSHLPAVFFRTIRLEYKQSRI